MSTSELAVGANVRLNDNRNGIIRYVGTTHFAPGEWVGVELEDDTGKNDGSVQGERYFECGMGHGMFLRPMALTVTMPPPPPPTKPAAAARKSGRPSSLFNLAGGSGSSRTSTGGDPGLGKRMSLNAPSPSPGPKTSRPSSITRSPTKSPTKQLATASSSASNSRTATPSGKAGTSTAVKPRTSIGGPRTSMGPPALPGSRITRQSSVSSTSARVSTVPARSLSGRFSSTAAGKAVARPDSLRRPSADSQNGTEATMERGETGTPVRSNLEILSPQPTSPVLARTNALERLTAASTPTTATSSKPPSATTRPAGNAAAANREIEDLKAKIRVLERKRLEDREKLKQLEKIQGERDKYESIIQKLETKYQPQQQEITELRKQLKEAEARFESVEAMQAEHETEIEIATLDREMAEETAEVLKVELEAIRAKAEELELEVEILREENSEFSKGLTPEERSSTGWLQMEKTNERLRQALLKLRDITQATEEELRDEIKGLQGDVEEFGVVKEELGVTKDRLGQSEAAIEDLRQQLDNALGAEDMIEDLTERNMSQAEQIEELKAVVEDLESLKEINDELEINHVQNEREMQEEIDFKDSVITEQARRAVQQDEALEDMEYTLSRFRELVTSLQGDLEDMRASHAVTETESEQLNSRSRAMMDLNMKLQISAAKAQVKTIDLELRRLEAQEAEQHLEIVKLFLPESYKEDKDSVLALLRFQRLAFKANLLQGFIRERVGGQPHPGHEDDIFAGCDAIDKLTWVAAMCDRFVNAINHCSIEQFAKYQGALHELEPVERALNSWIDGLRRDDLKEAKCASELQRTMALMSHLAEVHIQDDLQGFADGVHMRAVLVQSHLESSTVAFGTLKVMVQRVVPGSGEDDELAQHFVRRVDLVVSQTRSAKVIAGKAVRALEDLKTRSLSLPPETGDLFEQCEAASQDLAALARQTGLDLHAVLHEEGRTEPFSYQDVQSTIHSTAFKTSSASESDLFSAYLTKLRVLTSQITDIAAASTDLSQAQEFDLSPAPWRLRAQELKALKTIPIDAEEELRRVKEDYNEARRALAQQNEQLSTAYLKIETLDSRMRDAHAKASRIADLEAHIDTSGREIVTLKEDIEKQDRELKNLEAERDKWKKVAEDSRAFADAAAPAGAQAGKERAVATAREMDALKNDIAALQAAVRHLRDDNRRARLTEQPNYDWLAEPLRSIPSAAEQRRALVAAEGKDVLGELVRMAGAATVYDLSDLPKDKLAWRPAKTTPQYHAARQTEDLAAWQGWADAVAKKAEVVRAGRPGITGLATSGGIGLGAARLKKPAARLQIRLPGMDGKMTAGGEVQIVGSREWEGLQGRLAVM